MSLFALLNTKTHSKIVDEIGLPKSNANFCLFYLNLHFKGYKNVLKVQNCQNIQLYDEVLNYAKENL